MWLVAGKQYLKRDGVGEVGVFDEDGVLTVRGGVEELYVLKGVGMEKRQGNKYLKKGMLGKGMGALKGVDCDPLMKYIYHHL